jgi:hypothetical protein
MHDAMANQLEQRLGRLHAKKLNKDHQAQIFGQGINFFHIEHGPRLEEMGILLNECDPLSRGGKSIYLAGIDDAHYYRVDNIEKAASNIEPVP